MFERFAKYLQARYPSDSINFQLVHEQADQHPPLSTDAGATAARGKHESGLISEDWFQNRNALAFGILWSWHHRSSCMLSVLQARHHFVRQFALSHKVVIFDSQIHSYDTYMNVIIERLLGWLHAFGAPS